MQPRASGNLFGKTLFDEDEGDLTATSVPETGNDADMGYVELVPDAPAGTQSIHTQIPCTPHMSYHVHTCTIQAQTRIHTCTHTYTHIHTRRICEWGDFVNVHIIA